MKTLFLLLFFIIGGLPILTAQFLELGDKWIYEYRDYAVQNGEYSQKIDSIVIVADTLINGLIYSKFIASAESPCGIFRTTEFLREDNDRIYRLSSNWEGEELLIDFSNQNSYAMTFESGWFATEITTTVINDSIVTEVLPNGVELELTYQRILNNSSYENDTRYKVSKEVGYVEYGLLFPDIGTGLCDVYQSLHLRCKISGNDTIQLTALDCYESSITTATSDRIIESPVLYPNPSEGMIQLEKGGEVLSIKNLSGQNMPYHQLINSIDITHFPKGVYFVIWRSKESQSVVTHKVIKI